jgi:hypothetical protein
MKNKNSFLNFFSVLTLTSLLIACDKGDFLELVDGVSTVKKSVLKEFVFASRHYNLYYNLSGEIDSIRATEGTSLSYIYKVTYKGNEIDSVSLIDNGELVSTNKDFKYDSKGRITGYTYFMRDISSGGYSIPYSITYDNKGRITSINEATYVYDNKNNVIKSSAGGTTTEYTYDNYINPFYKTENLFALLVEETGYWEYLFSEHNSLTKITPASQVVYVNHYDPKKRLIDKTGTSNGTVVEQLEFSYY